MKKWAHDRILHVVCALCLSAGVGGEWFTGGVRAQGADAVLRRCASMERLEYMSAKHPAVREVFLRSQELISGHARQSRQNARIGENAEVIRIPVAVHVVHRRTDGVIGGRGNSNISVAQVESQIRILNEDYRKMAGTPGYNDHPSGADARIEFYLADLDPDGARTEGITRHLYTEKSSFNPVADADLLASIVSWPSDVYMNIWVCELRDNYLGLAQFPAVAAFPGLDVTNSALDKTDGVIIDYRYFGDTGAVEGSTYNRGRTATHEIGHWLGLLHIWGDRRCGEDYCDDTPPAERSNETGSCNEIYSSCTGSLTRNMIENYMDYSPDRCMNIFTADQVQRMQSVLTLSPRRARLVANSQLGRFEETEQLEVKLFPNPVRNRTLEFEVRFKGFQDVSVTVTDMEGKVRDHIQYEKIWGRKISRNLGTLSGGVYFLKIISGNQEQVIRRFIVN